jgi:hypothetical protein
MDDRRKARLRWQVKMSLVRKYRIMSPTIVLIPQGGRHVAHTLPKGSVVTVNGEDTGDPRLITVTWAEVEAVMFTQDLRSRGERISD